MPGTDLERRPSPPLPVRVRPRPESLPGKAAAAAARNPHLSVPLAAFPALWLGAEAAHEIGPLACGPVSTAAVLGTAWMWVAAPRRWPDPADARWWQSRAWWARATCAAGCGWEALASWLGPAGDDAEPLIALLLVIWVIWGARWFRRHRPARKRKRGKKARMLREWDAWWQAHAAAWGAPGSRVVNVTAEGVQVILRVKLVPGRQVFTSLRQHERLMESALEGFADAGMVRVAAVPGDASLADVFIKRLDPLGEFIEWEEELAPRSVHDPFPEGRMESGKWRMTRQRVSSFIVGMTRSGKTNGQLTRIVCLSRCPDARTVVIDLKGARSGRDVLRACAAEYVICTLEEARDYLLMLATEVRFRAMNAGLDGGEQLEATEADPALMTLIDECWGLTSLRGGDASCRRDLAIVTSQGAGVECYVDAAAQIGTLEESVGERQVRSNMDRRLSYRTAERGEGEYALGEGTRIDTSKLTPVGTFLAKLGPDSPQEKIRGIRMTREKFAEVAWSRLEDPPLALYCGSEPCPVPGYRTWQEWWARRWERLPAPFHADSPQYQAHMASRRRQQPRDDDDADVVTVQPAPAPAPRRAPPPPGAPDSEKRAAFCAALQDATAPASPRALQDASGLGKTSVAQYLRRLVERGAVIQRDRGEYVPAPGADIAQVLASVRAGDEELLRAAAAGPGDGDPDGRRLYAVRPVG